jgi:hypothetical protein
MKFDDFCLPRTNVVFEQHQFHTKVLEERETIEAYVNVLMTVAKTYAFDTITEYESLRDRPMLGMSDKRVQRKLLRPPDLTPEAAID